MVLRTDFDRVYVYDETNGDLCLLEIATPAPGASILT
jgi:hypothetical protein